MIWGSEIIKKIKSKRRQHLAIRLGLIGAMVFVVAISPLSMISSALPGDMIWQKTSAKAEKSMNWTGIDSSADGSVVLATELGGGVHMSTNYGETWDQVSQLPSRQWVSAAVTADGSNMAVSAWAGEVFTSSDGGATWVERTAVDSRYWQGLAYSADGSTLVSAAAWDYIYISKDQGYTWTQVSATGSGTWRSVWVSDDGNKIIAGNDGGYIYTSNDSGATWTSHASPGVKAWRSVSMSSDGGVLAAAGDNTVYVSTDGGNNWVQQTSLGSKQWYAVSVSGDGSKIAAVINGYDMNQYIHTTDNSGATWTVHSSSGSRSWMAVNYSSDGSRIFATTSFGDIYTSSDDGVTWNQKAALSPKVPWQSVASSADGMNLAVAVWPGYISTSSDGGQTWVQRQSAGWRSWYSIASSADGSQLVAITNSSFYISTDYGATWESRTLSPNPSFASVASSADGTKLIVGGYVGPVYMSSDSGDTWTTLTDFDSDDKGLWYGVAVSADGSTIVAVDSYGSDYSGGYVHVSRDGGQTWTQQTSLGVAYRQDWLSTTASVSADGNTIALVDMYGGSLNDWNGGYVYVTTDGGSTWQAQTELGAAKWSSIASSADGSKIIATQYNGNVYISKDFGDTWQEQVSLGGPKFYTSTASSLDGSSFIVAASGDGVYVGNPEGAATTTQPLSPQPTLNPLTNQPSSTAVSPVIHQAELSVTSDTCYTFEDASVSKLTTEGLSAPENNVDLVGGIAYSLTCTTPGGTASAQIVLGPNSTTSHYPDLTKIRIYKSSGSGGNLTLTDVTNQVTLTNQTIDNQLRTVLSYTLTDGDGFDEDHAANGRIVDPLFVGVEVSGEGGEALDGSFGSNRDQESLADTGSSTFSVSLLAVGLVLLGAIAATTFRRSSL